jgi:hypothetical protein
MMDDDPFTQGSSPLMGELAALAVDARQREFGGTIPGILRVVVVVCES